MSLSPAQLQRRRGGIAATDAAAIAGVHPYRTPLDVWLDKMGDAPPFRESKRSRWGDILEGPIRTDYERQHNVRVEIPGTLRHRLDRWKFATPDGLVYPDGAIEPERGLEIKVHGRDALWFGGISYGAPGTDEVPAHELVQCMWNIDVSGLDRWDLVPFLDGAPNEYTIERDDELIGMLTDGCEKFMRDFVERGEPPPPDGSKAWDSYLRRRFDHKSDDLVAIDTNPQLRTLVYELRDLRASLADLEMRKEAIVQELKREIGDRAGLTWREFGRPKPDAITWRRNRASFETDHEALATDIRGRAALHASALDVARVVELLAATDPQLSDTVRGACEALREIAGAAVVAAHTREVPGVRPFNVPRHWKRSKEDKERSK